MYLPLIKLQSSDVKERNWSSMAKKDAMNDGGAVSRNRARTLNREHVRLSDLTEIKVLGEGSFGRVTLVKDNVRSGGVHGNIWALKKMSKRKLDNLKLKVSYLLLQ